MYFGLGSFSRFAASLGIAFLVQTGIVFACEGECIVSITKAFVGNYSGPVNTAMTQMANTLAARVGPYNLNNVPAISFLAPFIDEYNRRAYDYMENAIFPSYFHGKCQNPATGIDPPGCPNPDCPVVCGTPGSMIHFYPKLRYISFDATAGLVDDIAKRGSPAYKQVLKLLTSAAASSNPARRTLFRFKRFEEAEDHEHLQRREVDADQWLHPASKEFRPALAAACGGNPNAKANGLPNCSWEDSFKSYILSFP
ncbi:hypothetical protein BDN70DRAFT_853562 [Pholiota conissans]|uniref:Uncharacterized protein n=1 Tax=Pholiota conissans TaxID=109636 RepID=A0A9P5Z8S7_9AGAR|nr:hypothetical protein BDN70DRAFT_853562 [Pholiota conissans]